MEMCSVKPIKISKSSVTGKRLVTLELEYPRIIHSEVMTHRMLSKNAASSRAIPVSQSLKRVMESPAMPSSWGSNNPGMQSKNLLDMTRREVAIGVWLSARDEAVKHAKIMSDPDGINAHKQIANRLVEPFVFMKTIMTGTEWANLIHLRNHEAADPTFLELAEKINKVLAFEEADILSPGEWHLPYVDYVPGSGVYTVNGEEVPLELARMVSASCTAQVSYRKLDDSIEKAQTVFNMLNLESETDPKHASPIEHQATPMQAPHRPPWLPSLFKPSRNLPEDSFTWEPGITHVRRDGSLWSGNLGDWVQYRQLVKGEAKW